MATVWSYTLSFVCPAFLGNAEQSGQWRTPPFKALLRQWWRVAYASGERPGIDVERMRAAEARLFGAAADRNSSRSLLRLRLDRWDHGSLQRWQRLETVPHPEVNAGRPVGSDLYLGYGPLAFERGSTALKNKIAIAAGEHATVRIALTLGVDKPDVERVARAISLLHLFGTMGGRNRNGWGSFALQPLDGTPAISSSLDATLLRPWRDALALDWPHAIGRDGQGALIWQTETLLDWKNAMKRLAEIRIGLRTQFRFSGGSPHQEPQKRHWLSYPVTRHEIRPWGNARLPNSLRFKLRPDAGNPARVRGVIFHVPCFPPPQFKPDRHRQDIIAVWERVHAYLDTPEQRLTRIPA
jgi:CRISPR-associated protein Cmr1